MSQNNISQTLFRFISLRNPNLAETSRKNLRFIIRPDGITGFFDAVVQQEGKTKLQSLQIAAEAFAANAITDEKNLHSSI